MAEVTWLSASTSIFNEDKLEINNRTLMCD